jgi:hypothetical protein
MKLDMPTAYCLLIAAILARGPITTSAAANDWFGIHVIDDVTGRGVPLVELETVNHATFITDSAGWIAIQEPGWAGRSIFFNIRSHGYRYPKDGFGNAGFAVDVKLGGRTTVRMQRANIAERLYRVTGEGIYRDSVLLGEQAPIQQPLINAQVAGQDSANIAIYHDRLFWFWGDTLRMKYPLGHFHTSGAWSDLPSHGGLDPARGVDLHYWTDSEGFSRGMCPLDGKKAPYLVWIDGVVTVPDSEGHERLVAHYDKLKTLGERFEHGIAVWSDKEEIFRPVAILDAKETWRFIRGHPARQTVDGQDYLFCGDNFPDVRVRARFEDIAKPGSYEAYTCFDAKGVQDKPAPVRDTSGNLSYAWRRDLGPVTGDDETRWLKEGLIKDHEARLLPLDADSGKRIHFHNGSTRWNPYHKRWIAIAVEKGGSSYLGEVWYAESPSPTGPWLKTKKILTHDRYSFYNPVQHDFFDQKDGKIIYFEGTYANTFSGNPGATARYDYNQIMYRLDIDDPRLGKAIQGQ